VRLTFKGFGSVIIFCFFVFVGKKKINTLIKQGYIKLVKRHL